MTTTRGPEATEVDSAPGSPPVRATRARATWVLPGAALTGLVAVLCGLALPFAPVVVSTPTVTWPRDPARTESTLLPLTAQRPLGLDVRFGCDAVRLAAAVPDTGDGRGGGTVVATALPGSAQAGSALVVTGAGDRVQVRVRGAAVVDEPVPAGACTYRLLGSDAGLPLDVRGPPTPLGGIDPAVPIERVPSDPADVAGPTSAEITVSRDGVEVGRWRGERLPDVDVLLSSLTGAPGPVVSLRVDDESTTSPTPVKRAVTVVLGVALLATLVLLVVADRGVRRPGPRWPRRPGPAALVDLAVVGVLALWTFVAPATDDDGYFMLQARNAALTGSVGDYVQFQNRSFTPFTWPYQALAEWQQWAGTAPVVLRVPAAVCGVLTWFAVRVLVRSVAGRRVPARAAAAVAFLAWWLPYDMGVRPEPVVALCAAATAALLLVAATTRRLAPAWLAAAVAGAGAVAHTGGMVLLGVLVAGLPLLVPLLRNAPADGTGTAPDDHDADVGHLRVLPAVLRAVAVGSATSTALLLGFADGALRDFLRGQTVTGAVFTPDGWADEAGRYAFLLDPIPMGSFARRAAVLSCLLALAWFAVLAVAARARRVALPVPLVLTASATALGFAALALTPSKWTHHFGSLAGVGAAFVGLLLITAAPLTREVLRGARLPPAVPVALAASTAVTCALVWHGPNSWPYAWLEGVAAAYVRPSLGARTLDHPLLWLALVTGTALVIRRTGRPVASVRAVALVVAGSLAASAVAAVAVFAVAGFRGTPPGSLWAQNLADPAGTRCGAAAEVRVLDVAHPTTLVPVSGPGLTEGFAAGGGFFPGDRPPPGPVWGSLTDRPGGSATSAWYALPPASASASASASGSGADATPVVLAAGNLDSGSGTTLIAVYGRRDGADVTPLDRVTLADGAGSPHWRAFPLRPPAGADAVRLEAVDTTGAPHGWVAFSAPALAREVPLTALAGPAALGWQVAFAHPCARPPAVVAGITEPATYAITRAADPDAPPLAGLDDMAWQSDRGGVYAHVPRSQSVLALPTVAPADPYLRVYAFSSPLARDAYVLVPGGRTVNGADAEVGLTG